MWMQARPKEFPLSLFLGSCAVFCMLVCQLARWVFPVSASLLLYVALCDWFDDLWPDCPSGHSRVLPAVYLLFCCDWISTASLSIWLANHSALSVKWMRRESDLLLPVPPRALSVFIRNAPVPWRLYFLLNLLWPPRPPPQLATCAVLCISFSTWQAPSSTGQWDPGNMTPSASCHVLAPELDVRASAVTWLCQVLWSELLGITFANTFLNSTIYIGQPALLSIFSSLTPKV